MPATPDAFAATPADSVLGFDFGTRLIGVAVGNRLSGSRALTTVNHYEQPDWRRLDALIQEWRPACLVVGLPLRIDGGEQAMSRAARGFAGMLEQRYRLDVRLVDERLTTNEAARRFAEQRAAGSAKRKHAATIDAIAAEVILENWFASNAA
jgi:putative Holliday junction resolvase